ncbi:MAG: efflux RND transporter periplasmic adaptor subunit [Chlamydiia bacterium]|nr:efflux RND transporter periplasmic adaptor subunit [Chlamydiia bacterium]
MNHYNSHTPSKRNVIFFWVSAGILLIALAIFLYWLTVLRFEEYTDDAYVHGNLIEITPQVPGIVMSINVDDTDYVQEGQVLIELDKTDYQIAFEKSQNALGDTVRSVIQMYLKVDELEAELVQRDAALFKAEKDYQNRVNLVGIGGVSREEFEHVEANLVSAKAARQATDFMLQAAIAEVQNTTLRTHPLVLKAADQVKDAFVSLQRCSILAPSDGYVAMRTAQLGEYVEVSQPLLAVVPLNELWVNANYKEVQLSKVRIGQSVHLTSDLYGGGVVFHGKIVGINPGTGNTFSILPPQNATGNWIKIVQRVPVRVSLDPQQLKKYPLWLGLSMNATVDIHDAKGEMLPEAPRLIPIYHTQIYGKQEEGALKIIEAIIQQNAGAYAR